MTLGSAVHTAVFEPDRLLPEYAVWEGGRRYGKEWDAYCASVGNKTILKPEQYDTACRIRDAVRSHPVAAALLEKGEAEKTIQWTDTDTGLKCKGRLDWLSDSALVDLKTTRDIDPRIFGRQCDQMLYHGQMAFYNSGLAQDVAVYLIAVESSEPHEVAVYELNAEILWTGEIKVQQALKTVAECRANGCWPMRFPEPMQLILPTWAFPTDDEQDEVFK